MTLHEKLVAIQSDLKAPKGQTNAFGKYKYRSCEDILEAVKPHLKQHGLILVLGDEIVEVGGRVYVKATAALSSGDLIGDTNVCIRVSTTAYARESQDKKGMDDAQITGSASSYARKYALNGLFCIDDTKDADTQDNRSVAPKKSNTATQEQIAQITDLAVDMGGTYQKVLDTWTEGKTPTADQAVKILAALEEKKRSLSKLLDSKL